MFYLLLAESMLIRAKVNFCDERLRNQAELNFLHWVRFLESSELKGYPERKFHFSAFMKVGPFEKDTVSRFGCPTWNMKEQKVKPHDIFTFKPAHPSCYTRIRLFCHTA